MLRLVTVVSSTLCIGAACGGKSDASSPGAHTAHATPAPAGHPDPHARGEDHAHGSPHGGVVAVAGSYHIEAVASKVGMLVYLLDGDEKALPISDVKGSVLLSTKDGKPPTEAPLEAMGNHLHAMVSFAGAWTAVVTLHVAGETLTARFEGGPTGSGHDHGGGGDAHGHDHGHAHGAAAHDHGAMPAMRLSETLEGRVTSAAPLEAGKPAVLSFAYHVKADGKAITDFEVVHEKKLHVFIVSEDMSFFDHVHPDPADVAAGTWTLGQVFPAPGTYHVYSDFKSTSAGASVTRTDLVVPGTAPERAPLAIDGEMTKTFGDLQFTLAVVPSPLAVGDAMLEYTVSDRSGAPVTDLVPYLGAFGHLFILGDDKVTMAHAHPRGPEPTPGMRGGPKVSFHTVLPAAGRYKLWAQFQRGDAIVTTDWTVEVR